MDIRKSALVYGLVYVLALIGAGMAMLTGRHWAEYLCRPLLMIALSIFFFVNSRRVGDRFTLLIQAGLFFSLIGDVALMFIHIDDFNFIIGLGAYFLAQLCYIFAFAQNIADVGSSGGLLVSILITFGIGTGMFFFGWALRPHLDEGVDIPVYAFLAALSLMGILAAFRFHRTYPRSFWLVLIGALLLIATGTLLITDRFQSPLEWAPVWVLVPYAVGQFMVATGALAHVLDPDNLRRRQALTT